MWLAIEPRKIDGLWYTNLNKIPNIDKIVSNKDKAIEMAGQSQCLTLIQNQGVPTSKHEFTHPTLFTMKQEACIKPGLAVCKLENSNDIVANDPPPRFPCIPKTNPQENGQIAQDVGKNGNLLIDTKYSIYFD